VTVDAATHPPDLRPGLFIGRWRVDPQADEIDADGRVLKLEPQQMRLLLALAEQPGQVVLTQTLLDQVWRDLVVTPNSVYQAVAQLRKQLGDSAELPEYIQTVHRKGYRLLAPVRRVAPAEAYAPLPAASETLPVSATQPGAAPAPRDVTAPAPHDAAALAPNSTSRRLWLGAGLLTAAAPLVWLAAARRPVAAPGGPARLAVLPFEDRSAGAADADRALARGLLADVIAQLGQHGELQVIAAESVQGLVPGPALAVAEIARRLDVRYLLLGQLLRAGTLLRVAVQLVEPPGSTPLLQREFQHTVAAMGLLPRAVAADVAGALGVAAVPAVAAGASEAYELYVLGTDAWRTKTPEAFAKAREYFQRGIDLDPGFARNYVGLGWTWLGQAGTGIDLPQAVARATPLFERALRLDPEAAESLTAQATLHRFAGQADAARDLLRRAIKARPSYAQAHHSLGIVEFDDGWPARAQDHFQLATLLNPLSASPWDRLAVAQIFSGRVDAARASAARAVELEPAYPHGHWAAGIAAYAAGELAQAVREYRRVLELEPRRGYEWYDLARLYLDLQRPDLAEAAFARCAEQLPRLEWPAVHAAQAWLARGGGANPPAALERLPQGGHAIEALFFRAMAGLPLDGVDLRRALDATAALGAQLHPDPWLVFQGHHRQLDLATVQLQLGESQAAAATLDAAQQGLDRLERQGNRFHALHFHRARLLALRGQTAPALGALEAAVTAGSRRGWWFRADPAFAALRSQPRFIKLLAGLDDKSASERQAIGL
jgi:DNA-binding winged helix-turn-helix (wHTH) protein/tetratricopeptide (TPR) repeat protein